MTRRLPLVPLHESWISARGDSGAPLLDLHAVYLRPRRDAATREVLRDEWGFVLFDVTGPLPVTGVNHRNHLGKGFRYLTLADRESLTAVSDSSIAEQHAYVLPDPGAYLQRRTNSPWDPRAYALDAAEEHEERIAKLKADIDQYGAERAQELQRRDDPDYVLPERLARPAEPAPKRRGRPPKVLEEVTA